MQSGSTQLIRTEAGRSLKWLYCLTLIAAIFPSGLMGAAGWVGLATGAGLFSGGVWVAIFLLAVFVYRIFLVVRSPHTLDAFVTGKRLKLLRRTGIFLMAVGMTGAFSLFFTRPIALGVFGQPGDNGVAFFVMSIVLYLVSGAGLAGVLVFEASRLFGFEAVFADEPIQKPASNITIKQPGSAA